MADPGHDKVICNAEGTPYQRAWSAEANSQFECKSGRFYSRSSVFISRENEPTPKNMADYIPDHEDWVPFCDDEPEEVESPKKTKMSLDCSKMFDCCKSNKFEPLDDKMVFETNKAIEMQPKSIKFSSCMDDTELLPDPPQIYEENPVYTGREESGCLYTVCGIQ